MKAYLYLIQIRIEKALAYRFDVFYTIAFQMLVMFTTSFFWRALYTGQQSVGGVSRQDMLTYTVISAVMGCILNAEVENRIIKSVEKGTVATDMLKPVNLFGIYFAEDIGAVCISLFQNALPLLLVAVLFIQVPAAKSPLYFLLFLLSLLAGYLINWLFAAIYGMWAFTAINMQPMVEIKKHMSRLLSGSIIPLWFFPDWLSKLLQLLPFPYIYQLPLSLYIGRQGEVPYTQMFAVQGFWLVFLAVLFYVLQKKVTGRVMVQGG